MPTYRSSTGVERSFDLTIEQMIEAEMKDPKLAILRDYRDIARTGRLSIADRLCRAFGTTYEDFVKDGFTFNDLLTIVGEVLEGLGFSERSATRSDLPAPSTSEQD